MSFDCDRRVDLASSDDVARGLDQVLVSQDSQHKVQQLEGSLEAARAKMRETEDKLEAVRLLTCALDLVHCP